MATLSLLLIGLAGCGKAEWRSYEETRLVASAAKAPESRSDASPATGGRPVWTTPEGWQEESGSGMRLATLTLRRGDAEAVCTLIVLGGAAGGVEANIQRWIGQLGLAPLSESELGPFLDRQERFQGEGGFSTTVVDLTVLGDQDEKASSMIAGIVQLNAMTLFLKWTGPVSLLRSEKEAFVRLCRSIRTQS